ncbi:MAG: fatty acid desaturase family protein [Actinomycetes bacterium]
MTEPAIDATPDIEAGIPADERAAAARFTGGLQVRIVVEFLVSAAAWIAVLVLGLTGVIPLWLGLILNSIVAATFYMPMHEAAHGNVSGRPKGQRRLDDTIGVLCSIPVGLSYTVHRSSHLRHHAFTNDPDRDPDRFTAGPLALVPAKWLMQVMILTLLPVFAFVPPARRLIPASLKRSLAADAGNRRNGLLQLRFWLLTTVVLVVAFFAGFGWPALLLWYLPARIQALWLILVFAWFPHHPARGVGRYVDTRVAVFPGSGLLIRGHDHHAMHHMFPRVPHYRLRALWHEVAPEMVAKGVRAEGRAEAATGPIVW